MDKVVLKAPFIDTAPGRELTRKTNRGEDIGNISIVIIDVGQTLRGDDAIGMYAVQARHRAFPYSAGHPEVKVEIF